MTNNVKGKTKGTGAKGKAKATGLKEFLSNLATDPTKLGEFLHKPEAAMSAANLSEADKAALRSGVAGMVAARLAGVPLDKAFAYMIHPIAAPPQYVVQPTYINYMYHPIAAAPQYVVQPTQMNYMFHPIAAAPQYVVQPPPTFIHPIVAPPQYVVQPWYMIHPIAAPPQYVVQSPPYYPR
jgi:hypothetical protein